MPDIPIGPPFETIRDAIEGMTRLETHFIAERDRRGVFVTAYRLITETLEQWISQSKFHDNTWVEQYAVSFANLYREALDGYVNGDHSGIPESWRISLESSESGLVLVIQDLILGINAHINRDLAFALEHVGTEGSSRYTDHTLVNDALREATEIIQQRITDYYASGLGVLDHLLGDLDEQIAQFNFEVARESAWNSGVALSNSGGEERELLVAMIEQQATALAKVILVPNLHLPWLIEALRYVEQFNPWWDQLDLLGSNQRLQFLDSDCPDPVTDLDEVIERLTQLITTWDRQRNRLSIYATVYRRITTKVKALVEEGGFRDPDWMVELDVQFANRYFDIICKYEQGRNHEIPLCWVHALDAVRSGQTMIVQDIGIQIVPRVVFDLPITLVAVGLNDNLEARKHDYEKTYDLFIEELDCIQEMIARKYSRLVRFMDILAGRLDETISNHLYTRARVEAWDDALALRDASSNQERDRLIRSFDQKAILSINQMLFTGRPLLSRMARIVRRLEEAFPGDWSDTIEECDQ